MARTLDHVVSDAEFEKQYAAHKKPKRDALFVWIVLVMIAVVGAHFTLNISGGTPTGYVTAAQDPIENMTILIEAAFVLFIVIMIVALIHTGISKFDHE